MRTVEPDEASAPHLRCKSATKTCGSERPFAVQPARHRHGTLPQMRTNGRKSLALGGLAFFLGAMIVGCEPQGPAGKVGESIDQAGKNVKDAVDPRGPMEKAGDKVDKATGH